MIEISNIKLVTLIIITIILIIVVVIFSSNRISHRIYNFLGLPVNTLEEVAYKNRCEWCNKKLTFNCIDNNSVKFKIIEFPQCSNKCETNLINFYNIKHNERAKKFKRQRNKKFI